MFDKLVVSTAQRRRGRTAKFFLGTVVIYLSTVAIAFAYEDLRTSLTTLKRTHRELPFRRERTSVQAKEWWEEIQMLRQIASGSSVENYEQLNLHLGRLIRRNRRRERPQRTVGLYELRRSCFRAKRSSDARQSIRRWPGRFISKAKFQWKSSFRRAVGSRARELLAVIQCLLSTPEKPRWAGDSSPHS